MDWCEDNTPQITFATAVEEGIGDGFWIACSPVIVRHRDILWDFLAEDHAVPAAGEDLVLFDVVTLRVGGNKESLVIVDQPVAADHWRTEMKTDPSAIVPQQIVLDDEFGGMEPDRDQIPLEERLLDDDSGFLAVQSTVRLGKAAEAKACVRASLQVDATPVAGRGISVCVGKDDRLFGSALGHKLAADNKLTARKMRVLGQAILFGAGWQKNDPGPRKNGKPALFAQDHVAAQSDDPAPDQIPAEFSGKRWPGFRTAGKERHDQEGQNEKNGA